MFYFWALDVTHISFNFNVTCILTSLWFCRYFDGKKRNVWHAIEGRPLTHRCSDLPKAPPTDLPQTPPTDLPQAPPTDLPQAILINLLTCHRLRPPRQTQVCHHIGCDIHKRRVCERHDNVTFLNTMIKWLFFSVPMHQCSMKIRSLIWSANNFLIHILHNYKMIDHCWYLDTWSGFETAKTAP